MMIPTCTRWRSAAAAIMFLLAAPVGAASAAPTSDPPVVRTRRALDFIGDAARSWQNSFHCSGCHKQAIPITALGTARNRGYEDAKPGVIETLLSGMLTLNSGQQANGCFTLNNGPDSTEATTFGGRGLEGYDRYFTSSARSNLIAAADCLLARQAANGRLASDHTELPVAQGDFITTTHGIFTWDRAFQATGNGSYASAASAAVGWLRGQINGIQSNPNNFTTQDKAMLLVGLGESGAGTSDADVVRVRNILASEQLSNGSWKLRSSETGGNAHATGQVVFAMRWCGYTRTDSALDGGTQWLLDNQAANGSWASSFWEGNSPSQIAPSMWGAAALATYPSPLNGVRVDGNTTSTISWSGVDGASTYDAIRGNVASLSALSDRISLGAVSCLAPATSGTSVADSQIPPTGQSFFYLMRIRWGTSHDIYGRSSGGLDQVPASGDCPP